MTCPVDPTISLRAYYLWEAEGRPDGRSLDHWLQAEAEAVPAPAADAAPARVKPARGAAAKPKAARKRAPRQAPEVSPAAV